MRIKWAAEVVNEEKKDQEPQLPYRLSNNRVKNGSKNSNEKRVNFFNSIPKLALKINPTSIFENPFVQISFICCELLKMTAGFSTYEK